MGVWGQAPRINLAYYQESAFGIADRAINKKPLFTEGLFIYQRLKD
jgi:hypothetical protein